MTVTLGGITRFIPAFAGNAASSRPASTPRPVHPRVCGERAPVAACSSRMSGSSPRLRGTRRQEDPGADPGRFIPAFAGNARGTPRPRCPRPGSSPRLRGTHVGPHPADLHNRFIPAFAGNAWPPVPGMPAGSVHPRVCGERISLSDGAVKRGGSSPRLRGTRDDHHRRVDRRRFIPAFAGNAPSLETQGRIGPVHPRVCGERCCGFGAAKPGSGSSPRLRGTHANMRHALACQRFIPAFAGNATKMFPAART